MKRNLAHQSFENQAATRPNNVALDYETGSLTYLQLNGLTNSLARQINTIQPEPDKIAAVWLTNSVLQVVTLIATQKVQSIFMPLDASFSQQRVKHAFSHCEPDMVIVDSSTHDQARMAIENWGKLGTMMILVTLDAGTIITQINLWNGKWEHKSDQHELLVEDNLELDIPTDASSYIYFTSGSTGVPKAILGRADSLAHFIEWEVNEFKLDEKTIVSQFIAFTFDAFLRDVFVPLCAGGTLCIPSKQTRDDAETLVKWIDNKKITLIHCVPSFLRILLSQLANQETKAAYASLRFILSSGEPLYGKDVTQGYTLMNPSLEFVNLYGPSETTMIKSFYRIAQIPNELLKPLPVGKPISNTVIAILNDGNLCGIGETGEIFIRTPYMTKGYYKDPERTKEVFVANPFVTDRIEIIYKTGDLGRYLEDHSIELVGRIDQQIKVNGVRIEPGEIELAMRRIDGIKEVVIVGRSQKGESPQLCCYYTGNPKPANELIKILRLELTTHAIPSYFVHLDELPLTLSGKIDRKALPLPEEMLEVSYQPPRTEIEHRLAQIWGSVLNLPKVGRVSSFFEIGGHSLKAMQLISRISKEFQLTVKLSQILKATTIAAQAELLSTLSKTEHSSITQAPRAVDYPLSHAQQRIWLVSQYKENRDAYNITKAYRLEGPLMVDHLDLALLQLIKNNEILRTTFVTRNGVPRQVISPPDRFPFQLQRTTLRDLPTQMTEFFTAPFDLEVAPLIRAMLIEDSKESFVFLLSIHHIIADAWSLELMFGEIVNDYNARYRGEPHTNLKNLHYKDYAHWQAGILDSPLFRSHHNYWLEKFSGEIPLLKLPTDRPRPTVKTFRGNAITQPLSPEHSSMLKQISTELEISPFMFLFAVVNVLLYKYSGQQDIITGTIVSGRDHEDLHNQIGFFANTLAIRTQLDPNCPVRDWLALVKKNLLEAYDHQQYPFNKLVQELDLDRDPAHAPLFDVLIEMVNVSIFDNGIPNLHAMNAVSDDFPQQGSKYDLSFRFLGTESIQLVLEFNSDLFNTETIRVMASHFFNLFNTMVTGIETPIKDLMMLSEDEVLKANSRGQGVVHTLASATVLERFYGQTTSNPQHVAVSFQATTLTYQQLDRLSSLLAECLVEEYHVLKGSRLGILMNHSEWLPVAVWAAIKIGAPFVPLDPSYPSTRAQYVLSDANVSVLLTDTHLFMHTTGYNCPIVVVDAQISIDTSPRGTEISPPDLTDLAYILYTSGTTGQPKGVSVAHNSLVNYILWSNDFYFKNGSGRCFGWFTSLAFDLSLTGIIGTLCRGDELKVYAQDTPDVALQEIFSHTSGVTATKITPSHLSLIGGLAMLEKSAGLETLIVGGEQLLTTHLELANRLSAGLSVYNEYGPTEATIGCTVQLSTLDKPVTIGWPIWNSSIYLFNQDSQLQALHLPGEIIISGTCLSQGYWNNKEETSRKFIVLPNGRNGYKTGDLAKWSNHGIIYMGRLDDQIKINGNRIEPNEIVKVAEQVEGVIQAVVLPRTWEGVVTGLICYYSGPASSHKLITHLRNRLPSAMIPDTVIQLESLPLTVNGKVDFSQLTTENTTPKRPFEAARNEIERLLTEVCQEVLGGEPVSIRDNFFQVGGDSIKAIQIASRLHRSGYRLEVKDMFQNPEIAQIASSIQKINERSDQNPINGSCQLTPVQNMFFDRQLLKPHHFNQAVLLRCKNQLTVSRIQTTIIQLINHHDALRLVFPTQAAHAEAIHLPPISSFKVDEFFLNETQARRYDEVVEEMQAGFDLGNGPLIRVGLLHLPTGDNLLIVIHHLVVDGVSWRIILEDLADIYSGSEQNPILQPKTDSFKRWSAYLKQHQEQGSFKKDEAYWRSVKERAEPFTLFKPKLKKSGPLKSAQSERFSLDATTTNQLLTRAHQAYSTHVDELILAGLLYAVRSLTGQPTTLSIMMESHGRNPLDSTIAIHRTVGWFTCQYPLVFQIPSLDLSDIITEAKEKLRSVPNNGLGYGVLITSNSDAIGQPSLCSVSYNYLGQLVNNTGDEFFAPVDKPVGSLQSPEDSRWFDLEFTGIITDGLLTIQLVYDPAQYDSTDIKRWMPAFQEGIQQTINHCLSIPRRRLTPSDFTIKSLLPSELAAIIGDHDIEDIFPLTPLQQGIFYHHLSDEQSKAYFGQVHYRLRGYLDRPKVEHALNILAQRHTSLRSIFLHKGLHQPMQVVLTQHPIEFKQVEITERDNLKEKLAALYDQDASRLFDLASDSLFRVTLVCLPDNEYEIIWSHHHIIMDGWCNAVLFDEYSAIYDRLIHGHPLDLPEPAPYKAYVKWLQQREETGSKFWANRLDGFGPATGLPKFSAVNPNNYSPARAWHTFSRNSSDALRKLATENNATLCTAMHALWAILLSRYNLTKDIAFGSIVSGRPTEIHDVDKMVGLFINCIPVLVQIAETESFQDLLRKVQQDAIAAQPNHYTPLSEINRALGRNTALFDHIVTFENFPLSHIKTDEHVIQLGDIEVSNETNYDFNLVIFPDDAIVLRMDFNEAVYNTELIQKIRYDIDALLDHLVENPTANVNYATLSYDDKDKELENSLMKKMI